MGFTELYYRTQIPRRLAAGAGLVAFTLLAGCKTAESPVLQRQRLEAEAIRKRLNDSIVEMLTQKGLWGDHPLVDLRDIAEFNLDGHVGGGIIAISGTVEGKTVQKLQFAWTTNTPEDPVTLISALATDRMLFRKPRPGTENPQPSITFDFDREKFIDYGNGGIYTAQIRDFGDNPHDYINEDLVKIATIRMTPDQFTKFRQ